MLFQYLCGEVEKYLLVSVFHREDGCFALQRLKFLPKISQTGKEKDAISLSRQQ